MFVISCQGRKEKGRDQALTVIPEHALPVTEGLCSASQTSHAHASPGDRIKVQITDCKCKFTPKGWAGAQDSEFLRSSHLLLMVLRARLQGHVLGVLYTSHSGHRHFHIYFLLHL